MTDDKTQTAGQAAEQNGDGEAVPQDLIGNLKALRSEVANVFGTTKVLEVPGYQGLLAVEFQYIGSEVTEDIARRVRRETKSQNGLGSTLLSSIDTLVAASKNILTREVAHGEWLTSDGAYAPGVTGIAAKAGRGDMPINFKTTEITKILGFDASDSREVVLGIYGSEHKINEANVLLSRWLTDKTRTMDEDFLG